MISKNGPEWENLRPPISQGFKTKTKQTAHPLACTSLTNDFITPTSVQLSRGPRKYETPFLRTSASIFC